MSGYGRAPPPPPPPPESTVGGASPDATSDHGLGAAVGESLAAGTRRERAQTPITHAEAACRNGGCGCC